MGGGITEEASLAYMVAEKDREIVELRARLDDKERMLAALRSVARNRDTAEGPNSPRLSICSSCGGIGSQSAGTGSRVNSYIAPLPSSQDLGLGLGRIRTKSMDDGLSMAMQMMKHSHRNSMHRVSSGSMPLVGSSATITQTPLPFPPANGTSTRHSHPRLKPFILPWKLATREARDAAAAAAAAAAASVSAGASSVAQSASTPASAPLSRSVSLTSSLRSAHRESAINETPQQQQRVELEVEVHAVDADEEDDNKSHDGDEEDGEAVISGRLEPGDEVDVNVARLSMGSRLERHDSSGSLRRREGFLSGFRNGGDGGIGRPPEIGVEELGLGEIVDVR
ncbi:hypothetical protein BDZ91DRAFT_796453 [Kalaharituber pfeilii]|nr:hypothetical protein BDZ91DRAFT_796453 [Kalaharituber pfeilii]